VAWIESKYLPVWSLKAMREISRFRALWNGVMALAILAVGGFGVVRVARRHWQWQETYRVEARFHSIAGLEPGGKVRIQGMDAGIVEAIVPPRLPGGAVTAVLRLDARLRPLVRSDAVARIATQGVVGAKLIEITPGTAGAPALGPGQTMRTEPPMELADLIRDASGALRRLDAVAVDARKGLGEINSIAAGVREGKGSLGRLVQDEKAYEKLVALSDRGQKTLSDLEDNLAALKRTWPLSRYFNDRAFFDRDRVLYQPGSEREARSLAESELFEPGRAVLTATGRHRLDDVALWFKTLKRPRVTEVVVAAFTDDAAHGTDLAQALTQEQAEAVRKYLIEKHAIDWNGFWNARRKVAAVGFGTQAPAIVEGAEPGLPARRVDIILFTPQA
jgi:phospholipid/cholesterol/gamma-HCH transport system substrate-binding protein